MKETNLQLQLAESGDFIFQNVTDDLSFTVEYATKKLSAKSLFETLAYTQDSKYLFLEDIIKTDEVKMKENFVEIKNVITDICDSITEINFPKEDDDTEESEAPF